MADLTSNTELDTVGIHVTAALTAVFAAVQQPRVETDLPHDATSGPDGEPRTYDAAMSGDDN